MKNVYLEFSGRMHSLYEKLLRHPPEGYRFVTSCSSWDQISRTATRFGPLYFFQEKVLGKFVPVNYAKARVDGFKKPPKDVALTYAAGHLVFRREPWVVDLEFVTQLAGYNLNHFRRYRRHIERKLASEYCRRILCWTQACRKTVLLNLDSRNFANKVEVVNLAVEKKHFKKHFDEEGRVKLLFVGSANIPGGFEYKGGIEVLRAFQILRQKYHNLELVIRSDVSASSRAICETLPNVKLIEGIVSWKTLEQEFKTADIFLFPSHSTPGLAILDAMSYELPVITTDVWANPEMVEDGKTGFVIKRSEKIRYYSENFIPNWNYSPTSKFMASVQALDHKVVDELVGKTSIMIEDEQLRRRMGKAGRKEIETGKFSLEKRNERLKTIFDEATDKQHASALGVCTHKTV